MRSFFLHLILPPREQTIFILFILSDEWTFLEMGYTHYIRIHDMM